MWNESGEPFGGRGSAPELPNLAEVTEELVNIARVKDPATTTFSRFIEPSRGVLPAALRMVNVPLPRAQMDVDGEGVDGSPTPENGARPTPADGDFSPEGEGAPTGAHRRRDCAQPGIRHRARDDPKERTLREIVTKSVEAHAATRAEAGLPAVGNPLEGLGELPTLGRAIGAGALEAGLQDELGVFLAMDEQGGAEDSDSDKTEPIGQSDSSSGSDESSDDDSGEEATLVTAGRKRRRSAAPTGRGRGRGRGAAPAARRRPAPAAAHGLEGAPTAAAARAG
jgi:hypothetical protein